LLKECTEVNSNTHLVSNEDDVKEDWLERVKSVGVCGATSTPRWLMERVRDRVLKMTC
ncbi:MAG: 4-hydroxy-3-methylbut-2-enyl diphosphate reductase, partial [Muribaculaceae bacterium]|nr:4-hydroxy-3-methylbut-2-enyl diphosphate reductase [Muribaculaceae bacterium]